MILMTMMKKMMKLYAEILKRVTLSVRDTK